MNNPVAIASNSVTGAEIANARLGVRFGRMDRASQLALLAVEPFAPLLDSFPRDRVAIVLAASGGSLSTDVEYWKGRDAVGGLSPTLFTYTLPSAAIGEIAIRHRLTGPNVCFTGDATDIKAETNNLLQRGEADACLCINVNVVSQALSELTGLASAETASAELVCWKQRNL